jgi:hypothetical protein
MHGRLAADLLVGALPGGGVVVQHDLPSGGVR